MMHNSTTYTRKKTIETVEQFDFLKDVVANVPDPAEQAGPSEDTKEEGAKPSRSRRTKKAPVKEEEMEDD